VSIIVVKCSAKGSEVLQYSDEVSICVVKYIWVKCGEVKRGVVM